MKKRAMAVAASSAVILAAAVPAGSAFAKRTSPQGQAIRCAALQQQIAELRAEANSTSDANARAALNAVADRLASRARAKGCSTTTTQSTTTTTAP